MLAGFLMEIVRDRRLLREAASQSGHPLVIRYGRHELLPHHLSLINIRQRGDADQFRSIFERTVWARTTAWIAKG